MFGKKKKTTQIDQEQLELIKNAQNRVKQKKRLYYHFVIMLIGATILIILNVGLGLGEDVKIFDQNWFVIAILAWVFLFVYHFISVFITHNFMGKEWEKLQIEKLASKQQERINKLKEKFLKEESLIAKSELLNKSDSITSKKGTENKSQELTIIVAAAENNAIGKDNQLIWHLSNDLKRFKKLTSGHHIIMGRKTFESFPKPLPNRTHVVITRQSDYMAPEGVIVVNSLTSAIEASSEDAQPFIIGGGEIYKQALLFADKIELTRVHHNFEADTFFPEINKSNWKESSNIFHSKDNEHDYEFSFITYIRK